MDSPKTELRRLGERIQEALEVETRPAEQLRVARSGLMDRVTNGRSRRPKSATRLRYAGAAVFGTFALAAAVMLLWPRPITFVTDARDGAEVGDVLEARHERRLRVAFSEGSVMSLRAGARARVLGSEASGARVLLEGGVADVSIAHPVGRAVRWRFEAGPFVVLVKGTRFELDWQPTIQALSLTMKEGAVELSGACLPAARLVERGATLRVSCAKTPLSPTVATAARAASADSATLAAKQAGTPGASEPPPVAHKKAPQSFEAACAGASKTDLLALANRERLAGRVARARTALLALRQRFPGSLEAGTAAFMLGRMAFDQRADYAEAARYFTSYLAEQPSGPLMGDAAGRLLEAHERQGQKEAARRDAEAYLSRFPDGPYANRARRILAE
jgi:transmembrane sensor